jgi:hypothetical protein
LQLDCCGAGQRPAPSQVAAAVTTAFEQLGARQAAVGYAQDARLVPSQAPPQAEPSVAQAARPPRGSPMTAVQTPLLPARLQASHCPPQALSQQTPSTQFPVAHCEAAEQAEPPASSGTQSPPEHQSPATQSVSAEQLPLQAAGPHWYGAQAWVCGAGQWPAPSQAAANVATPEAQLGPRHCPVEYAQAAPLLPSHSPPQADPSVAHAGRAPCGAPATARQVPAEPKTSQAWHCPLQAWSQQTPSTQFPVAHWLAPPHEAPATSCGTQTPAAQ